jgi:hypothetical protein
MGVGARVVQEAARAWGDPTRREQIVQMHAEGRSLVEMTEALGLGDALDADGLRDVVASLSADEVRLIRDAFVAEADRVGTAAGANFPVECALDDVTTGVRVVAAPTTTGAVAPVVRIERA